MRGSAETIIVKNYAGHHTSEASFGLDSVNPAVKGQSIGQWIGVSIGAEEGSVGTSSFVSESVLQDSRLIN